MFLNKNDELYLGIYFHSSKLCTSFVPQPPPLFLCLCLYASVRLSLLSSLSFCQSSNESGNRFFFAVVIVVAVTLARSSRFIFVCWCRSNIHCSSIYTVWPFIFAIICWLCIIYFFLRFIHSSCTTLAHNLCNESKACVDMILCKFNRYARNQCNASENAINNNSN